MKKLTIILLFICMMFPSYSQSGPLYGIWLDNGTQKFVSVDEVSGERSVISNITGNPGVVNGSATSCTDSGQYIFVGYKNSTGSYHIYTIDIIDGTVKYQPVNPDQTGEYVFDAQTDRLYGLWRNDTIQKLVSVNRVSGERTEISDITGNPGVVLGSSSFCADSGQYIFIGYKSSTASYYVYTIDIKDGSVEHSPLNPDNTWEYKYDPVTNNLVGLWRDSTTLKLVSVDRSSGMRTEISDIPGNPGVVSGSSAFDADSGRYIFVGISGDPSTYYLYTIDITNGTVKNKVQNPDNTGEYEIINYMPRISAVKPTFRKDQIEVYPNPVSGNLPITIPANIKHIEILSINGQPVRNYEIVSLDERCTLNLSGLSDGIYFVRLTDNSGQVHITKLVINN